jgi:phosphatidylinositol-4-phosphate 3-kinase
LCFYYTLYKEQILINLILQNLHEVAENIKTTKESLKVEALKIGLQNINGQLVEDEGTCLPLSPSRQVIGINVVTCSYFPSFTLPLKINFIGCDNDISPAIFKVCKLKFIRLSYKFYL